ncbi:cartilage intermediate layer protein 1-like [Heptranchias perlo]|uniref:cartilage intermediate layer protein 1-like n=1 Tax=Heptranchias perlo TaxID=212740 RepID=UPI00355A24DD
MCKGPPCATPPPTAAWSLSIPVRSRGDEQPAGCELECSMGRVNAQCSRCMCEEHLLYGSVHLQDGAPASKATVYLRGNSDNILTVCDEKGKFRIPGLCPDGKTALKIKKAYYGTAVITLNVSNSKQSTIEVKLKRSEKPYISKQPVSKVRREGQSVTFCCKVLCDPPPDKYFWSFQSITSLLHSVLQQSPRIAEVPSQESGQGSMRAPCSPNTQSTSAHVSATQPPGPDCPGPGREAQSCSRSSEDSNGSSAASNHLSRSPWGIYFIRALGWGKEHTKDRH